VLRGYCRGNPEGKTFVRLTRSALEPPAAGVHGSRLARRFSAPYNTLADVDWACRELEWSLERDARVLVMRPSPIRTRDGWRSPCDEHFDPFWARVDEAGITVVAHVGSTGYTANGYGGNSALDALGGGRKPSVAGLIPERAIYDFLLTFAYDVWINPFWEDRIPDVIEQMGADRVIYGSDWPHMEGMEHPQDILAELDGVSLADREKLLYRNTAALNERRAA
jgi:hypothetical protein